MTSPFCRWVSEIYDYCVWIYGFGYFTWWWVCERGGNGVGLGCWSLMGLTMEISWLGLWVLIKVWEFCLF